jgi:hypothetical protein
LPKRKVKKVVATTSAMNAKQIMHQKKGVSNPWNQPYGSAHEYLEAYCYTKILHERFETILTQNIELPAG